MKPAALSLAAALLALTTAPSLAQSSPAASDLPKKPITKSEPSAVDVAATPVDTLNLRKKTIPQVLLDAEKNPYTVAGLGSCGALVARVTELNRWLGDDVDIDAAHGRQISVGRIAQSVVGSFIPFGGIIREVSGANAQQRALQSAITAGIARRSFLKGYGQAKGCPYPARAARR